MKKKRNPNKFKGVSSEWKIRISKEEKKKLDIPYTKKTNDTKNLNVVKLKTLTAGDVEFERIVNNKRLKAQEIVTRKEIPVIEKSKKPNRVKVLPREIELKDERKKKAAKQKEITKEAKLKREKAIAKVEEKTSNFLISAFAEKRKIEKRKERKARRTKELQLKNTAITSKISERKEKSTAKELKKSYNRKVVRAELNGRLNGRKIREKDRIVKVMAEPKRTLIGECEKFSYFSQKTTKKNKYRHRKNKDATIRKVVVVSKIAPLKEVI